MDSGFINRPIEGYDELAFIFSGEKYPSNTLAEKGQTIHSVGNQMSEDPDGNKSLYLVFVGVVFLSILDCF
jgi:hypothetical protein